jgi:hypothetical protein
LIAYQRHEPHGYPQWHNASLLLGKFFGFSFCEKRQNMSRTACLQITFLLFASVAVAAPTIVCGVAYDTVDEGEPFLEAPAPAQSWDAPKPFMAEQRAGLMAFLADDPGKLRFPKQTGMDRRAGKRQGRRN